MHATGHRDSPWSPTFLPCSIAFNDTIIPYSGYNVRCISSSGNAYPGWPQAWQLNGGFTGTVKSRMARRCGMAR